MNTGMLLHLEMSKRCILECRASRTILKGKYTIDDLNIDPRLEELKRKVNMCGNMGDQYTKIIDFVKWLNNYNNLYDTNGSGKKISW